MAKKTKVPGVKLGDKFYLTIGDYLTDIRIEAGFNRASLCRKLGYKGNGMCLQWEKNVAILPIAQVKRFARLCNRPCIEVRTMLCRFEVIEVKKKWGLISE